MTADDLQQYKGQTILAKYKLWPHLIHIVEFQEIASTTPLLYRGKAHLSIRDDVPQFFFHNKSSYFTAEGDDDVTIRSLKPLEKTIYNTIKQYVMKNKISSSLELYNNCPPLKHPLKYLEMFLR